MTSSAKRLSTNPSTLLFFQETYKGDASYLPLDSIILQLPSHDLLQLELILEGKNGDNSGSAKSKDKDKDSTKTVKQLSIPRIARTVIAFLRKHKISPTDLFNTTKLQFKSKKNI